ncbi:MAG: hypothetical protein LBK12_04315, partial [Odoribacteraceae bacterium]|nr:hypothetical protein [Odoribacteraceae bacterium]
NAVHSHLVVLFPRVKVSFRLHIFFWLYSNRLIPRSCRESRAKHTRFFAKNQIIFFHEKKERVTRTIMWYFHYFCRACPDT